MGGDNSFIETINALFGGAVTTLIGAFTGRLMYHSGEVKLGRRRFFGKELLWEIPVAIGMAIIGEAAANYLGLGQPVSTGLVATLAYLGPRGAEALICSWLGRKK
ncbi:phage holin family protein [Pseudogemmobacter sp. W21_MBD1_M6]|uniref:phage holin family protein n=1 Tax=Pseudogemmobacter sp. W21_MBD1_M6 TaxID=3240271 RepID=UPI003F9BFF81